MPSFSLNGTARHGTAYRNINRRKNRRVIPTVFGLQTEIFAHIRSVTAASLYIDFIPCLGFDRGRGLFRFICTKPVVFIASAAKVNIVICHIRNLRFAFGDILSFFCSVSTYFTAI